MKNPRIIKAETGEKMQYMVHEFNDNTIRFVVEYDGTIDAEALKKAAAAIVPGVDILHSSFIIKEKHAHWYINEDYSETDYFSDFRIDTQDSGKTLFETALQDAMIPVAPGGKVQLHCSLFRDDEKSVIVFRVSHLCADGSDGKYLLYKLAEAYNRILLNGNADGLEIKNGNRAPEQVYENLSRKEMRSLLRNPMTGIKTAFPFPAKEIGEKHIVWKCIPKEVMEEARLRAKTEGATVNDILLTACYHGFAALPGADGTQPLSIQSFMDLRKHCKGGDSEGLSNLSGSLATVLRDGIGTSFLETMCRVAEQTARAKEAPLSGLEGMPLLHGATHILPMDLLQKAANRLYGGFSIGLTNIGNLDSIRMGALEVTAGLFGGPMKKKPGVQVCTASFGNQTTLSIIGEFADADAVCLQKWLDLMAEEIRKYALGLTFSDSCDSL